MAERHSFGDWEINILLACEDAPWSEQDADSEPGVAAGCKLVPKIDVPGSSLEDQEGVYVIIQSLGSLS